MATPKYKAKNKPYGRSYISDVNLSLGVITVIGDLVTPTQANAGKEEDFKLICPTCGPDDPTFMGQRYHCTNDHGPFVQNDIPLRGQEVDGKIVVLSAEAVAAAKKSSYPEKELELHVHDAAEVDENTFPTGKPYIFWPSSPSMKTAAIFLNMVDESGHCDGKSLVGVLNNGRGEKVMRLQRWRGMLVLQEMARPQDVKSFEFQATPPDEKLLGLAKLLVDNQVEPFDPDEYKKGSRDRVASLVGAVASGETVPDFPQPALSEGPDLEAMLVASLAAVAKK